MNPADGPSRRVDYIRDSQREEDHGGHGEQAKQKLLLQLGFADAQLPRGAAVSPAAVDSASGIHTAKVSVPSSTSSRGCLGTKVPLVAAIGSTGGIHTAKDSNPSQSGRDWIMAVAVISSTRLSELGYSQEEIQQFCKEEGLFRNDPSQRLLESLPRLLEKDPLAKEVREVIYKFNSLAKDPDHHKSTPRP